MNRPLEADPAPAWLEQFRAQPREALDAMLRGLARIPPYEQEAPPDILDRLFGSLPADHPDLGRLDETLCQWLDERRKDKDLERQTEYGLPRFVTETMDALSTIRRLELPRSKDRIRDRFQELTRWAAPLRLSQDWDLPRALALTAALTQTDRSLHLYWLRLCQDAARISQRGMIDPALSGLINLPDTRGPGANRELIAGLARFGAGLAETSEDQRDFLRHWRALETHLPRTDKTWRSLWQVALTNHSYRDKPFVGWLQKAEPELRKPYRRSDVVLIPPNIRETIKNLTGRAQRPDQRPHVLAEAEKLLTKLKDYAEAIGDAGTLVRSACNLGNKMLFWAPGHALVWARDALRWSSNHGYAWDLRGRALQRLGHPDIAQAVYWEAVRRLPDNAVLRNQLARFLLQDRGREREAEEILRQTLDRDPDNPVAVVELARLLARTRRENEAESLFHQALDQDPGNPVAAVELARLLARTRREDKAEDLFRQTLDRDPGNPVAAVELARLLARLSREKEAEALLRQTLTRDPGNGIAANELARLLARLGREEEAEALFRQTLDRDPGNAVAVNELARLLARLRREKEAEALFRRTLARNPSDTVAANELARLLVRTGREDEAEKLLGRVFEDFPHHDPVILYNLALVRIAGNRPEAANVVHARYVQTFGNDPRSTTLRRLLDTGAAGVEKARHQLADNPPDAGADGQEVTQERGKSGTSYRRPKIPSVISDTEAAKREAALRSEKRSARLLHRAAEAGRADRLFQVDTAAAERTLDRLIEEDPGDLHPQVVRALHVPERRMEVANRYRETLCVLAPHLAAAGPETSAAHWEQLYEMFPERRGLIDFTRLMRGATHGEAVSARLEQWITDTRDEKDAYLRNRLEAVLAKNGRIDLKDPQLIDRLNDSIRAEVDLDDHILEIAV